MNNGTKDEYEIQHFGFCADDFVRSFFTMIVESMSSLMDDAVTQSMDMQKTGIASNLNQIHAAWLEQITPTLELFTSEIAQIFGIPDNVALPEDLVYKENRPEDIPELKSEIKELTGEYLRLQAFRKMLKDELELLKGMEPVFEKTKQFVKECDDAVEEGGNVMRGLEELGQQLNDCKLTVEESESYALMSKFLE